MLVTHNAFDHRHVSIDVDRDRLEYFHGCSLHTLGGNDFGGIFRLGEHVADVSVLPPYAETAKFDRARRLERVDLVDRATSIARLHIAAAPTANTVMRHAERSATDLDSVALAPVCVVPVVRVRNRASGRIVLRADGRIPFVPGRER